jgi:hypothetical protein
MKENTNSQVIPVVIKDACGALRSRIFASRDGLVRIQPLEHDTGIAVKAVIADNALSPSDYVVRSVRAGSRRKLEVLAGALPFGVASALPEFRDIDENNFFQFADEALAARTEFGAGQSVVLADGNTVVEIEGAVSVAV